MALPIRLQLIILQIDILFDGFGLVFLLKLVGLLVGGLFLYDRLLGWFAGF